MRCLRINNDEYKRIKFIMGNGNHRRNYNKNNSKESHNKSTSNSKKKVGVLGILKSNNAVIMMFIAVIPWIWSLSGNISAINENINSLQTEISSLNSIIGQLQTDIDDMYKYLYEDEGVKDQLGDIREALNLKVINVTDENTMALLEKVSVESNNIGSTTSAFDEDMPIGADSNGNVYIARDLIGKTILLTYKAEGKDIFFLGQYNENYHWEGYCVINAYYSDGRLYGICESNYDDGKRLDYKTICTSENDEWGYYSRVCNGTINEGVSIEYTFSYNKIADFTTGNVRISDILYADDFLENQDAVMYKFYSGSTADGKYNDDSGNAYRVKFYEDGTVKALYIGQFKNGQRDDDTGNAWDISYNEKLECYKYTTGVFKNGYAENKLGDEISLEQINEIIAEYNFGCELKWKE